MLTGETHRDPQPCKPWEELQSPGVRQSSGLCCPGNGGGAGAEGLGWGGWGVGGGEGPWERHWDLG